MSVSRILNNLSKRISLIKTFGPSILIGYFDLLQNLMSCKEECLLNVSFEEVTDMELELLSLMITLSPGTIAIKTSSNTLLIHSLTYAKSQLVEMLTSYSRDLIIDCREIAD